MEEPSQRPPRIELEVRPGSDPIDGRLRDASGIERRFHGWVDLSSALEALRSGSGSHEATDEEGT